MKRSYRRLTLVLAGMVLGVAETPIALAQTPPKLRVLVTECINATPKLDPGLGWAATQVIYSELANSGKERFSVIHKQEVWAAAERLGLPVPEETAAGGHWTPSDKRRLANELHADAIIESNAGIKRLLRKRLPEVEAYLTVKDVTSDLPINGGRTIIGARSPHDAITAAVEEMVLQCIRRAIPPGLVIHRMGNHVDLNRGVQDGFQIGDRCFILRKVAGKKVKVGELRVIRAFATDSEAEIMEEKDTIRAGDTVLVCYYPACIF